MSDDPRTDIAEILAGTSYRQMTEIAESLKDFSDDAIGVFDDDVAAVSVAEFLFAWANAVIEDEGGDEEAGE